MDDDTVFQLTPKGYVQGWFTRHGLPAEAGDDLWDYLQAACMRRLRYDDPDAEYAALIFDGGGGTVVGACARQECDD